MALIKLVEVETGEVIEPAYVQAGRFWLETGLRKDGKPSGRVQGKPIGVRRAGTTQRYWIGRYAVLDSAREELASAKRGNIARLEAELADIKEELYRMYEEPQRESGIKEKV